MINDPRNKQEQIKNYYLSGGTLTVVECRERFHTTELRRINSRLKTRGLLIVGEYEEDKDYKRYRLGTEAQQRLAI